PAVFRAAWRVLGHAADAEDVVQEVFLEAVRLVRTQPVDHWGALLRRMAVYRALDRRRRRKPVEPLDGLALAGSDDGPHEAAAASELRERLRQAVAQLPQREGAVFCLRYFEELSYQEIATALNTTTGAVSAALHKARGKLEEGMRYEV
ncbi:MAG: RNA polymerase sigma factor, partial [Pirellulales bacterium]